jgi:hypothetical protein
MNHVKTIIKNDKRKLPVLKIPFLILFWVFLICSCKKSDSSVPPVTQASNVSVYPALSGNQYMSGRYEVDVLESNVPKSSYVYKDPVNDLRFPIDRGYMTLENHFTSFSFKGEVVVQVKLSQRSSISTVTIRPLSKNLKATISGNTISIPLKEPANIYVEVDGESRYPLFIFANAPESGVPPVTDPNVIYFAPGIHDIGFEGGTMQNIPVGKTIYLAGGAFVKGRLKTAGTPGTTTIRGRGILSGIDIPGFETYRGMIEGNLGTLLVEGIVILDAPQGYQGIISYNSGCILRNVKMLAWAQGADAGALGRNAEISNCFFKINDDVLKPIQAGMVFKDNIVWQQMCGVVIMFGWNSVEKGISATVSGLDIIGCDVGVVTNPTSSQLGIISLKNSNGATYTNMLIENIRIEKKIYHLLNMAIKQTDPGFINNPMYNKGLGSIDGMTFRNIAVPNVPVRISYIYGNGNVTTESTGDIKNVVFENVTLGGTPITAQNAATFLTISGNTSNISYK